MTAHVEVYAKEVLAPICDRSRPHDLGYDFNPKVPVAAREHKRSGSKTSPFPAQIN